MFSPSSINNGAIKSLGVNVVSATKLLMAAFVLNILFLFCKYISNAINYFKISISLSGCKTTSMQLYSLRNYKVYNTLLQASDIAVNIISLYNDLTRSFNHL